jgi:tRNA C32,U32 (ribose-2'-O)-methylase TrmJ
VHHADKFGVDALHIVDVDDRLDLGHMHVALDALHILGAIHVAMTLDVLVHLLGTGGV